MNTNEDMGTIAGLRRLTEEWEAIYQFAGWLSENGEDLHELPNEAVIAIVDRFFKERRNG